MLIRLGAWTPEGGDSVSLHALSEGTIIGVEIGPPVIQYGPCYLHTITQLGKDGSRTADEHYRVMLGIVETPIVSIFDFASGRPSVVKNPGIAE